MRLLTIVGVSLVCGGALLAQGTVLFNNSPSAVGGAGARIYDVDGTTPLAGTRFVAQLYAGPNPDSLAPVGAALWFRTGAGAGFVNTSEGTTRVIPTVAPGQPAYVQVRAWEPVPTTYWELAPIQKLGVSPVLFLPSTGGAGEPPSIPVNLVGLQGFHLEFVPEPGVGLLVLIGAGASWLRRRTSPTRPIGATRPVRGHRPAVGMNLWMVAVATLACGGSSLAQGTVLFNNSPSVVGGTGARVVHVDGTGVGAGWVAQLYAGPVGGALAPVGGSLPFRTFGAGLGFINTTGVDVTRVIPTVAPGGPADVQLRAWWSAFVTYEAAVASGVCDYHGQSMTLTVATTGGVGDPPTRPVALVGLQGFVVGWPCPEPSSILLGLLGAGVLWRL